MQVAGVVYQEIITGVRKLTSAARHHANSPINSLVITVPETQVDLLREMTPDIQGATRAERVEILVGNGDLVTAYF